MRRVAPAVLAFVCASIMAAPPAPAGAQPEARTIAVTGTGVVRARPDTAHIATGVVSEAETGREALDHNSQAMTKVVAALKEQGIEPADIQTTDFSVHPRYQHDRDGEPPAIIGYRVVNAVRITVRDIDSLGAILDQVVGLGSNQIGGIQFTVNEPSKLEAEARRRAMADAAEKADLYAEAAGAQVGQVMKIAEESEQRPPRPMMARALETATRDVPIEAGEHSVRVEVQVTWTLD